MDSRSGALPHPTVPPAPGHTGVWRFTVAPAEVSVPRIRHMVRDLVRGRRAPLSDDRLQAALLVVSELVTNAVRHAALLTRDIGVEVALDAHWLRLSVEDGHPYRPRALEALPEEQHTSGRGLLLVKVTALDAGGDCGVEPTAIGGKIVWATLPLDLV
ncbi:ATP-binding protein [Streptomyces sp. MP131-18]|uniref:ATP-binding protein n=1 Tax=Streptomyces sp. MP131-18 TaxID=1857892 RepID=UPI00097C57D3|nr:ATP-binding protein [Streptomyces sp. MP131-18]ONK10018.1 Histidine kinase-, DNA gyrase B-, and HSP90-likeATPase [Streptomyces sp. MP131-18]